MQYTDTIAHIIDGTWIVMMAVWIVSAFTAKRTAKRGKWMMYRLVSAAAIVAVILLLRRGGVSESFFLDYIHNDAVRSVGAAFVVVGVAVAIWARFYLGKNWGMPVSEKVGAELVTSGPYAYIRNPIYSGVLLALVGSALAFGVLWLIVIVPYVPYFFYSVFAEEKIMLRLFPDAYPAYKARTKRLIPWVW